MMLCAQHSSFARPPSADRRIATSRLVTAAAQSPVPRSSQPCETSGYGSMAGAARSQSAISSSSTCRARAHSSAKASNALYRRNLAKGQTGLSVAFDLPTQTGYDPDHEMARGEVGRVGVPVAHLGDAHALFDGIEQARPGNHLSDISHAVQQRVERDGLSVIRTLVGHGIGRDMHEDPQIPNFGDPGKGPELQEGMALAIEPMVNAGGAEVRMGSDGWAVYSSDDSLAAHFEFTVAVTADGPRILTPWHLD